MSEQKYDFFVDPTETVVTELGEGFIKNFLAGNGLSKGFATVTQKRFYAKGNNYRLTDKGHIRKYSEECAVDLKDINGTGTRTVRFLPYLLIAIGILFLILLWNICYDYVLYLNYGKAKGISWSVVKCFADTLKLMFGANLSILNIPSLVFAVLYFVKKRTFFTVTFAGGNICFRTDWYGAEKIADFQKKLRQAMAEVKEKEPLPTVVSVSNPTTAPIQSAASEGKEKVETLREYAKLKEDGIITEEEFQKMKSDLMGG